jgi:MFS family permease
MLLWGATQPFAGALADRFGAVWVLASGAVVYAVGTVGMAYAHSPLQLHLSAGVLIGLGLGGCSFTLVLGAFGKLLPESWRTIAFGAGTAAGSFGQFLFSPLAVALIREVGWQETLLMFGGLVLLIVPLAMMIAAPRTVGERSAPARAASSQTVSQALSEAFGHRSYLLLVLGYFTCGFQLFFMAVHLPAYLVDRGLPAEVGGWAIAVIGLANIVGSVAAGYIANFMPRRYLLSLIYFSRSIAILAYIMLPPSIAATLVFSAVIGLLWLSTIPPTSALVAIMFGQRWLTMLLGVAFFSHQVGGFLGVWLGGVLFERTGSYDVIWWGTILLGLASAVINLPIVEKPVARPAAVAA